MDRSYDVRDVESWTRQAAFLGPKRVAMQCAATSLVVFFAAAVVSASWSGFDVYDAVERGEGGASGVTVSTEAIHLWLPEALAFLASPDGSRDVLRDPGALRRFLERGGWQDMVYAVTYRAFREDGRWTDIIFTRRPYDEPVSFQELLDVLAGDGTEPGRRASLHVIPESILRLGPEKRLEAMRRIADDGDRREPTTP